MFNLQIPMVSREEILNRYRRIRPIVNVNGDRFYLRSFTLEEVYENSFLWNKEINKRERVIHLPRKIEDFLCLHSFALHRKFKPSIYEVLAQIDDSVLPRVEAFEIVEEPEDSSSSTEDALVKAAFNQGYHVSMVRLYGR